LGIGDWAQSPIPNPQSPIPNPHSGKYLVFQRFNKIYKIIYISKIIIMETNSNNFLPPSIAITQGLEPEIKITDFEQIENLGTGGYGKVNLYRHKITGAEYAIKLIDKTKFENKLQKELFAREVEIMYKIRHPNIVRLYTHFEDESNCYIVLEYIKKGNLYKYTQSMPNRVLDAATTANFVVDLVSSLYYLHNMNPPIIHRDIKPENLLLGNNGQLKLTDFGGSNYLKGSVRFTTCGTQIYHSPEMLSKGGYDTRVDIWAIGVLIFELMVGRPPFKSDGEHSMEDNIMNLRINWPESMNIYAKRLITDILKVNPKERPTLENILDHQFILNNVKNPKSRLILPSEVELKPFIISRQIPGEDLIRPDELRSNLKKRNEIIELENEEYKSLYENLKADFEKIIKEKDELSMKKDEIEIKIKTLKKYIEESKKMYEKEIDEIINKYLEAMKNISMKEEENKSLKQDINLLEKQNEKLKKEINDIEINNESKIKKFNDDIKLYKDRMNQIFQGKLKDKSEIEPHLLEYSDNSILSIYKKENDNLKKQNSKYLEKIEELEQKLKTKLENLDNKETKKSNTLYKLLKEKEDELDKKNIHINKLYDVLADISNFMNKITIKNFQFFYEGNSFNNIENIKKLLYNIQPRPKSNVRSSSNSKGESSSNKRNTNIQRISESINYYN
jgi:aurora kinase